VYDFLSYFRVACLRGAREEPEAERVPSAGPAHGGAMADRPARIARSLCWVGFILF